MKRTTLSLFSLTITTTIFSTGALAGGYEWSEASFSNPAVMVFVKQADVKGYLNAVQTYNRFTGTVTDGFGNVLTGTATSDPIWNYPTFDAKFRIGPQAVASINFTKPYGQNVRYPQNSIVAPSGTITFLDTYNISPNIAYSVTPKFSIGAGIDFLRARAALGSVPFFPNGLQFLSKFNAAWGVGVHAGFLYQIFTPTFFDMVYYAQKKVTASGTSKYGNTLISNNVEATLVLPNKLRFTLTQFFKKEWYAYVSSDFTQWGKVQQIVFKNNTGPGGNSIIPLNYRNTWSIYLGSSYDVTPKFTVDGGVGYDPTSVNKKKGGTSPNLPAGTNSTSLWFEGTYTIAKPFRINAGYSHFFLASSKNQGVATTTGGATSNGITRTKSDAIWLGVFYVV